jgi:hypothetical protein
MCVVVTGVLSGRNRLTARSESAGTSRSTGSLSTVAPAAMFTVERPRNASARSDAGSVSASLRRRAMRAPPITSGRSPNVFESLILMRRPPALVCTIRRTLWLW